MSIQDGEMYSRSSFLLPTDGPTPGWPVLLEPHPGCTKGAGPESRPLRSTVYCWPGGLAVGRPRGGVVGAVVGQRRGVGVQEMTMADGEVPRQIPCQCVVRVDLHPDALATDGLIGCTRCRGVGLAVVLADLDPDRSRAVDHVVAEGGLALVEVDPLVDAARDRVVCDRDLRRDRLGSGRRAVVDAHVIAGERGLLDARAGSGSVEQDPGGLCVHHGVRSAHTRLKALVIRNGGRGDGAEPAEGDLDAVLRCSHRPTAGDRRRLEVHDAAHSRYDDPALLVARDRGVLEHRSAGLTGSVGGADPDALATLAPDIGIC